MQVTYFFFFFSVEVFEQSLASITGEDIVAQDISN
jgi:hypothetical protein